LTNVTKNRRANPRNMFQPLPLYIGLRYVRTRRRGFFVSFISWVSMVGVALGVAALIVILSVMNGFEAELRTRLLNLSSHATVSGPPDQMSHWQALAAQARTVPGVIGVAPYSELQGMVGRGGNLQGAKLRGVLIDQESQVADVSQHMTAGSFDSLTAGSRHIALGAGLAWQIQAQLDDEITVLIPEVINGTELRPRMWSFTVTGIFEVGAQEIDNSLALVSMQDAMALTGINAPSGLRLKVTDLFAAPTIAKQVATSLAQTTHSEFTASDWTIENASYFRAVSIEKTMMSIMLMLIVAIAAANIVAALVMVVNEKRTDIAILRTLGLSPQSVVAVFITQGLIIGWFGILSGLILGLSLAFNVDIIVPWLEQAFNMQFFDPSVYYITQIPSEVHASQVLVVTFIALILTTIATIYPARRGAHVAPAEALRYE
jgi:lipoprotein-releasing system permease protein